MNLPCVYLDAPLSMFAPPIALHALVAPSFPSLFLISNSSFVYMAFDILLLRKAGQTTEPAEILVGLLELCSGLENGC